MSKTKIILVINVSTLKKIMALVFLELSFLLFVPLLCAKQVCLHAKSRYT